MVVVFGELVASEVVTGDDSSDGSYLFEDRQVPIDAGLRQPGDDRRRGFG